MSWLLLPDDVDNQWTVCRWWPLGRVSGIARNYRCNAAAAAVVISCIPALDYR